MIIEDITRALIRLLREEVYPEVDVVPHADFGEVSSLPTIVLTLPVMAEVLNEARNVRTITADTTTGRSRIEGPPSVYDLEYAVTLASNTPITTPEAIGILDLQARYLAMVGSRRVVEVDGTPYRLVHEPSFAGGIRQAPAIPIFSVRSVLYVRDVVIPSTDIRDGHIVLQRRFKYHKLQQTGRGRSF